MTAKTITGAANLVGGSVLTLTATADVRNRVYSSGPSSSSAPLDGGFGPGPGIVSATADDPSPELDYVCGAGDTITIVFDEDTDQSSAVTGTALTGPEMELLIDLDSGSSWGGTADVYDVAWTDVRTLSITVVSTAQADLAIGTTTFTALAAAGIRNAASSSAPSVDTSPALAGDWGPQDRPDAFGLAGPADAATVNTLRPTLTWDAARLATSYEVTVVDAVTLAAVVSGAVVTGTSYQLPAGALGWDSQYTWTVTAHNDDGQVACDASFGFTVGPAPAVPSGTSCAAHPEGSAASGAPAWLLAALVAAAFARRGASRRGRREREPM